MEIKCDFCGDVFNKKKSEVERNKSGLHFCSKNCFNRAKQERGSWFKKGKNIICEECGDKFYATRSQIKNGKRFCSTKCMGVWNSKNRIGENSLAYKGISKNVICEHCSKEFIRTKSNQKYCSYKCSGEAKRKRVIKTCCVCEKEFERVMSQIGYADVNFCSIECQHKFQRGSGHSRWVDDRDSLKSNKNKRYRESVEMDEWKIRVFKRDDYVCKMCEKRGGILNAHHILPLSENYDLAYNDNNGITLCETCHRNIYGKEYEYVDQFMRIIKNV